MFKSLLRQINNALYLMGENVITLKSIEERMKR
jgi:hypothetical protein